MGMHDEISTTQEITVDLAGETIGMCDNCDADLTAGNGEKVYCQECFDKAQKVTETDRMRKEVIEQIAETLGISLTERVMHMTLEDEVLSKVTEMHETLQKIRDLLTSAKTLFATLINPL